MQTGGNCPEILDLYRLNRLRKLMLYGRRDKMDADLFIINRCSKNKRSPTMILFYKITGG